MFMRLLSGITNPKCCDSSRRPTNCVLARDIISTTSPSGRRPGLRRNTYTRTLSPCSPLATAFEGMYMSSLYFSLSSGTRYAAPEDMKSSFPVMYCEWAAALYRPVSGSSSCPAAVRFSSACWTLFCVRLSSPSRREATCLQLYTAVGFL